MDKNAKSDEVLAAELEELAEAFFRGHGWAPMKDQILVAHIRSTFTAVFLEQTDLQPAFGTAISRNLHVGVGHDGEMQFVLAVFFGTGSTYFYYEDPSNSDSFDRWIVEMAELQVENFAVELDYLDMKLSDWFDAGHTA